MSKFKEQIFKDKLILYIWTNISELWVYSKLSLCLSAITLIIILIFYNNIACWLFGNADESRGKLLTLLLSVVGAVFAIYTIKNSSKRIKQGNEQLLQQEKNNTNTRFKDAIILLGNDNPAVVLGGIHTLNQIAIDNLEYRKVIADILCNYAINVSNLYERNYPNINLKYTESDCISIVQLIVDLIFAGSYDSDRLDFSNARFDNIKFKNNLLSNILIDGCRFNNCQILDLNLINAKYQNITFKNCKFDEIQLHQTRLFNVTFDNCKILKGLKIATSSFNQTIFDNSQFNNPSIDLGTFIECTIHKTFIYSGTFKNTTFADDCNIYDNHFVKIKCLKTKLINLFPNNSYLQCKES